MLRTTLRTRTPRPLGVGLAAAALGLGLALSGCMGGGSTPPAEEPPASSAPAEPSASQPAEPSTEASTEPSAEASAEPSAEESTEDGGGSDGEKPSVEEVSAGVQESIGELAPIPEESGDILGQLTTCAVEKIYDDASAESLQAMADGQLAEADADDLNALSEAISECSTEITSG